jgi:MoaA/NifB/PqqE/SkfB family radical SAM enzyme
LMQIGDPKIDWQKNRLYMKAKTKRCAECKYFNICEGVWEEYIDFFGTDEFKPVEGDVIRSIRDIRGLLNHSK